MSGRVLLDLSQSDVHVPSATQGKPMAQTPPAVQPTAASKKKKRKAKTAPTPVARTIRRVSVRADIAPGGSMHVRHHLRAFSARGVGVPIDRAVLAEEVSAEAEGVTLRSTAPGKLVWIQLAEQGSFKGHPAGPFELNAKVFEEIVANFAADGLPVPIDAEHASEMEASSGSIPQVGAPAFGWIHKMENRGASLWGLVEWHSLAREYIEEGRYRFLSPAVRFGSRDRVTGKQTGAKLTSAALTNQPFLKGMAPLTASERDQAASDGALLNEVVADGPAFDAKEILPQLRKALRLSELATPTECEEQLDRVRELYALGNDEPVVRETMVSLRDVACAGKFGASWSDVFETVQDMIDAAIGRHVVEYHATTEDEEDEGDETGGEMISPSLTDKDNPMTIEAKKPAAPSTDDNAVTMSAKLTEQALLLREKETEITALKAENDTLRKFKTDTEEAAIAAEVDEAIETHASKKGITMADKPELITFRKTSPAAFAKLYPRVEPSKRHLLRELVKPEDRRTGTAQNVIDVGGGGTERVTLASLTTRLMKEESLDFAEAQNRAYKMLQESAQAEA